LGGICHEGDAFPEQGLLGESGSFRAPTADREARFLGFRCIDPQEPHTKPAADIVDNVDGVAVDDLQHQSSRGNRLSECGW
jgi:hypothetical protein